MHFPSLFNRMETNFEKSVAAAGVGLLIILHQVVQRWIFQRFVHQGPPSWQSQSSKLPFVCQSQHNVVVKLSSLQQGHFVHLRLEIDWKASQARDPVGEVDAEDDSLHALDGQWLSHHGLDRVTRVLTGDGLVLPWPSPWEWSCWSEALCRIIEFQCDCSCK